MMLNEIRRMWNYLGSLAMKGVVESSDFSRPGKGVSIDLMNAGLIENRLMQQNGFASRPVKGTDCVMLSVNGSIDHQIIIATEKYGEVPVDLAVGDTVIYSIGTQAIIHLKANGDVDIVSETNIKLTAPDIELNGTSWADHTHEPGTYTNGAGAVSGVSGGIIP